MGAEQRGGRRYSWDDNKRRQVKKDHGVYTEHDDGTEIRLITAWRANRMERSLYYRTFFGERYGE